MARGDAPRDSYHLVGISFFILGLGTLLPWNFFITAIPYFQARLAGANSTAETLSTNHTSPTDTFNFNNWVTLLSQLPLLLFTLLNSFLYQCIPESVRILGSLLAILLLFALTAALVKVDLSPGLFFSITMASVWFINSFCAVLQGSLFGQLGTMPSTYSTLFLSGQGLAGIFAALAMLMSMASGVDAQTSALGYFITPCVGILLSVICYLSLPHLEFARYYLVKKLSQAPAQELETKAELLQADEKNGIPISPQQAGPTPDLDPEKEPELDEPLKPGKPSVFVVFRKIWLTALCLVLVFTVTLSVFPAITAMVTSSTSPGKWSRFFNPICCFLLFNTMDWLGRSLTSYFLWVSLSGRNQPEVWEVAGDQRVRRNTESQMRTAGCCPCWCACASCLCHSSCCAMCPSVPGCPSSSGRTPTSSPSCCSSPFPMAIWFLSPCAWRPGRCCRMRGKWPEPS
ncbi:equilibrative nucleoside transporter 2 isoform X1 [Meriones unguiculatus]|uniref:equilibrative nucleoside transporter 2 isoform X1 n=1 Tax=Meriones unguiculatus TaxID=10047 RepID=UPI00293F1924|nr:equilibrative nucleoside transporter 2 isoform X1 [Meriones unguiculatus]